MLFAYTYVPHAMEKMQSFIDFIFFEVWCKAPGNGSFRLDLFDANPELKGLMEAFNYGDTKGGDSFYGHVERIYGLCAILTSSQIDQIKKWYQSNNDIENVCANDPAVQIARYADIAAIHSDLSNQLASFFKGLYSQDLLGLTAVQERVGKIDEHYRAFMQVNTKGKCPFCGITDMFGVYHTKREAYDHYLPKGLYPFNSLNFRNLAPACHHCNSSYKTTQDPAYVPKDPAGEIHRRKAFYPFSIAGHSIDISINLNSSNIAQLEPANIQITFGPPDLLEEIETWKDVYGIEERYRAKCCGESDGKYWLTQLIDEWKEDGRTPADYMNTLCRQAAKYPLADSNFLKRAFLEGCQRAGLFPEEDTSRSAEEGND